MRLVFLVAAFVATLAAANIDGQWAGELQAGGRRAADAPKVAFVLNLKSQGETLTGTVTATGPKGRSREIAISDGRLTGDSFRFVTMQKTKQGENKIVWSGSVKGDELTGSRGKEGAKRAPSFTAKRKV